MTVPLRCVKIKIKSHAAKILNAGLARHIELYPYFIYMCKHIHTYMCVTVCIVVLQKAQPTTKTTKTTKTHINVFAVVAVERVARPLGTGYNNQNFHI